MKRTLAHAALLGLLPLAASAAQTNPNWPGAYVSGYAYTYKSYPDGTATENLVNCASPIVTHTGPTRSDPASAAGSCSFSGNMASTLYQYSGSSWTTSPSTLNAGTFATSGSALANPGANQWSASASLSGNVASGVTAYSVANAYNMEYIRVSDPASIYKMVLSASNVLNAAGSGSYARAELAGYMINPFNSLNYQGSTQTQVQNGNALGYDCTLTTCVSHAAEGTLTLELSKDILNANGVFAAYVTAYAQSYSPGGNVNGTSSVELSNLRLTIYEKDGAGNVFDATSLHTVTFDPNVTVTPEPASLALMGTGVAMVLGVAYRRRRKVTS